MGNMRQTPVAPILGDDLSPGLSGEYSPPESRWRAGAWLRSCTSLSDNSASVEPLGAAYFIQESTSAEFSFTHCFA